MSKRLAGPDVETMHSLLKNWNAKVSSWGEWYFTEQAVPIIRARQNGWKVAVSQAQAWKRGLRARYGFDVRRGVFLTPEAKAQIQTPEDLIAFTLHLHCYRAACEMVTCSAWLIDYITTGKQRKNKDPLDFNAGAAYGLLGIWGKLMEGFVPYVLYALKRGQGLPTDELLVTFVRASISRTVPGGTGLGGEMDWAQAVQSLHPNLPFEKALAEELSGEAVVALQEIPSPILLTLLPGKVTAAFEKMGKPLRDYPAEFVKAERDAASVELEAAILNILSPGARIVFLMMLAGHTPDEIATRLSKSLSAIHKQQAVIRQKITENFGIAA